MLPHFIFKLLHIQVKATQTESKGFTLGRLSEKSDCTVLEELTDVIQVNKQNYTLPFPKLQAGKIC